MGLARSYAGAKPAALLPGLSIQRTLGGEETYRFTVALQAATGNIGIAGGSSGGEFWGRLPGVEFPSLPIPDISSLPSLPVYCWPDAVLAGRAGGLPSDIHAIYSIGANYLNQGSYIKINICLFKNAGLVVTHDLFMTPTAQFSDMVLPATTFLEREDMVFPSRQIFVLFPSGHRPAPRLPDKTTSSSEATMKHFNKDEKELMKSIENEKWISVDNLEDEVKKARAVAYATVAKSERMNIRLSPNDLKRLKVKAMEEGMPYQTLVSSVIHKYLPMRLNRPGRSLMRRLTRASV